jgi:hypothetical protein
MAVEALGMRDLDAAEDELAPGNQLMDVIADANVNHGRMIEIFRLKAKKKKSGVHRESRNV